MSPGQRGAAAAGGGQVRLSTKPFAAPAPASRAPVDDRLAGLHPTAPTSYGRPIATYL
jgi:hypothetical protein